MMESIFYSAGQRYHVIVFNLSKTRDRFDGVKFYGSAVLNGVVYGILVFESVNLQIKETMVGISALR
ncbi:hypothetical protein BTA30_21860 [Bacillus swezeyi]|uniref:Uncharacterized protein n=1 Tax=Bacillus swezeyi TaxID=1925020 RepID=A0A1R1Q7D4_9BACI|nr:hypothetical protein BW143_21510 [Bacillus swezeyi]OMI24705.1 hypothetical protein BTA30_21860 [Bacillus swezeyi]